MRCIGWLVVAALCACSSGHVAKPHIPTSGSGTAAPPPGDGAPSVATEPSEGECEQLFGHVIALHLAELRRTVPTDQLPTEEEQAQLRTDLAADGECRKMRRSELQCALAATTLTDVEACQASRSSSTSNSSVAPGGITRPAPRSP